MGLPDTMEAQDAYLRLLQEKMAEAIDSIEPEQALKQWHSLISQNVSQSMAEGSDQWQQFFKKMMQQSD